MMPFVTEEIFGQLPTFNGTDLMVSAWPDAQSLAEYKNAEAENSIGVVCDVVGSVRSIRARYGLSPKQELDVVVSAKSDDLSALLQQQQALVCKLANICSFNVGVDVTKPSESSASVAGGLEIYVVLQGLVDFEAERARLNKELAAAQKDEAMFSKKLSNPGFLNNAKPEIVEKDKAKLEAITQQISRLQAQIAEL